MAVGFFTITKSRSSVADETAPYLYNTAVVILRKENSTSSQWSFFLQPFQPLVYAVLVTCLLLVLLLLLLLDKCQRSLARLQGAASGTEGTWQWVMAHWETLLAGLLNRCERLIPSILTI